MADQPDAPSTSKGAETGPLIAEDFLVLVTGLSRFIYQLARIPVFREFGLGLAEWAALSLLAHDDTIEDRQLGALLGLTEQRLRDLKTSLEAAHLISMVASTSDPTKISVIVTKRGKLYLEDINAALMPLVNDGLQGRPNAVATFDKILVSLGDILKAASRSDARTKRKKRAKESALPPSP
jgi:DNA-binding MarR family transcriptional regulator